MDADPVTHDDALATLALDHVVVALPDLGDAVSRLERRTGLTSLPGGRHPAQGTANRLVPLRGSYLELLAVEDPSCIGRTWLATNVDVALRRGRPFVGWAVRTDRLDAVRDRIGTLLPELPPVEEGERIRSDGGRVAWRIQHLVEPALPLERLTPLPFLIEWVGESPVEALAEAARDAPRIVAVRTTTAAPDPVLVALAAALSPALSVTASLGSVPGVTSIGMDGDRGSFVLASAPAEPELIPIPGGS